jgi:hypothetical protein
MRRRLPRGLPLAERPFRLLRRPRVNITAALPATSTGEDP